MPLLIEQIHFFKLLSTYYDNTTALGPEDTVVDEQSPCPSKGMVLLGDMGYKEINILLSITQP